MERTRSWDAAPYRLNGSKVYFFAIGAIQGRTLIAYVSRKWGKTVVRVVQPAVNLGVDLSQEDGTTKLTSRFRVFRSALCGEWFRVFREYLWPERLSGLFFLRDSIVAVCTSGFKIADPIKQVLLPTCTPSSSSSSDSCFPPSQISPPLISHFQISDSDYS